MREGGLAHDATGHHASRNADFLSFPCRKVPLHLLRTSGDGELGLLVGIVPLLRKFTEFFPTDARLLDELAALRAVDVFFHSLS